MNHTIRPIACAVALAFSTPAVLAQASSPPSATQAMAFDIPAQPAAQALQRFIDITRFQLLYAPEVVRGVTSKGVSGTLTPREALGRLLDGTGLQIVDTGPTSATIRPTPAAAAAANLGGTVASQSVAITGTRLTGAATTAVVQSRTREEIDRAGYTSSEDVVRSLTQGYSGRNSGTGIIGQGSVATGVPRAFYGSSSVDLRGLGEGSTLVLVNGRRMASSAAGGQNFVDISTLPSDAIDRVDILTGGASAIYGSDAVAGVVNFVLRKRYDGAQASLQASTNANGGGEATLSLSAGTSWATGHVMGGVSLAEVDPVMTGKVLTSQDFRSRSGRDFRSQSAQPGQFTTSSGSPIAGANGATRVTFPANQAGQAVRLADAINISDTASIPRVDALTPQLTPKESRNSLYLTGEQELSSSVSLFADVLVSQRVSKQRDLAGTVNGLLLPAALGGNPQNPFTDVMKVSYSLLAETSAGLVEAPSTKTTSDRISATFGLKFDLPAQWSGSAYVGTGESRDKSQSRIVNQNDLDPTGTRAFIALNNPNPANALNVFGNGSRQSTAALAGLFEDNTLAYKNKLDSLTVQAEGTLFTLRGKPVKALIGAEVRQETLSFDDVFVNANSTASIKPVERTQRASTQFAELSLPLVSPEDGISGVNGLTISAAARRDAYSFDAGVNQSINADLSRATPALGLLWSITDKLAVRANWSRVYKMPSVNDLFAPQFDLVLPFFPDPLSPTGLATNVHFIKGGNPQLKEQSGKTATLGVQFNPTPTMRLFAAYTTITYDDLITDPFVTFNLFEVLANPARFPGTSVRNATGALTTVRQVAVNLSSRKSESLDLAVQERWQLGGGQLDLRLDATRALRLETVVTPGDAAVSQLATSSGPSKWRTRLSVGYTSGPLSIGATLNDETGYTNADPTAVTKGVGGFTTLDLNSAYKLNAWNSLLTVGIRNAFNTAFPFVDNSYGFDSRRVDLRGRQFYAAIRKTF